MKSKSLITTCIAFSLLTAVAAAGIAMGTRPTKLAKTAYGSVDFVNNAITAQGSGFTITRQGVGLYTIKYDKPFTETPTLVIDPEQKSIERDGANYTAVEGEADPTHIRCIVTAQSATSASIECAGIDPTSRICTDHTDEFGNTTTTCIYTRLEHADIPFSFSAFGN